MTPHGGGLRSKQGVSRLAAVIVLSAATMVALPSVASAAGPGISGASQWVTAVTGSDVAAGTMTFGASGETGTISTYSSTCGGTNLVTNATFLSSVYGDAPYLTPPAPSAAVAVSQCLQHGDPPAFRTVTLSKPVLDPVFYINNLDASNVLFSAVPAAGTIQLTKINSDPNLQLLTSGTVLSDSAPFGSAGCGNSPPTGDPTNWSACGSFQMTQNGGAVSAFRMENGIKPTGSDGWHWSMSFPTVTLSKQFSPASIVQGATSQLTLTIDNPAIPGAAALSPLGFTDSLPTGVKIADPSASTNGACGAATVTDAGGGVLASGDTGVKVAGVSVGIGATCVVTVDVTSTAVGAHTNNNSNLTTTFPNLVPNANTTLTVTAVHPSVSITKTPFVSPSADQNGAQVGNTISYQYDVTNTGDEPLASIAVSDPSIGQVNCNQLPVGGLPVNGTVTCTSVGTHLVTQADVDAGSVDDTATASGTDALGNNTPASNQAKASVPMVTAAPSLLLTKTADASLGDQAPIKVGETIQYSYTVRNTGNVDVKSISVSDPTAGSVRCDPLPAAGLAPDQTVNCQAVAVYTVTQADVDAGVVIDKANASGVDPSGGTVKSNEAEQQVNGSPSPMVSLDKVGTVSPSADQNGAKVGDAITYTYTVTNIGNVTLASVAVADPTEGTVSCEPLPTGGLPPGGTDKCTANAKHTVTQADVDAGMIVDVAQATGKDKNGVTSPESNFARATIPTVAPVISDSIVKDGTVSPAGDQSAAQVGDTIRYSYTVTNTGNVDQKTVTVDDPSIGHVTCQTPAAPGLPPGQSEACAADATYTVTQADVDAGEIDDTATATGTDPHGVDGPPSLPGKKVVHTVAPAPTVSIQKTANVAAPGVEQAVKVGDRIYYSYRVTNTGNVTLQSVSVDDDSLGVVSCPTPQPPGLAPNDHEDCTSAIPHVVTQADVDAGSVVDQATATGVDTNGNQSPQSAPDTATELTATAAPSISITKTADASGGDTTPLTPGETVQYRYLVKNTGNVTLTTAGVTDDTMPALIVTCDTDTLAPGDATNCQATTLFTVPNPAPASEVDTATATGTPPTGPGVTAQDSVTLPALNPAPGIAITKTATTRDKYDIRVGDSVIYTYLVTNTGNVPLTNVAVNDPTAGNVTCDTTGPLAPGEHTDCAADNAHVVAQADVDTGVIPDTAIATGTGNNTQVTDHDSANVYSAPGPLVSLTKVPTVSPAADQNGYKLGDTVAYAYTVKNVGNVTLASVAVTDPTLGHVTCPPGSLAPQDSVTCHADTAHTVTQADVDAGKIVDTGFATGTDPLGDVSPTATDTATVTATPANPLVSVVKQGTVSPAADAGALKVGDTITYSYVAKNTGNVTLKTVSVKDPTLGTVTCPTPAAPGLVPNATETCNAANTYTVTQADVDAGHVEDRASVTGIDTGDHLTPTDHGTDTHTSAPKPAVSVVKTATVTPKADQKAAKVGDRITYKYVVTNTGNVDLTTIKVSDPSLGAVGCPIPAPPGLAPGKSETCTGEIQHMVTNADVRAGKIVDKATATGTDNQGHTSSSSGPSTATVKAARAAKGRLVLRKAASNRRPRAGKNVNYKLTVTDPTGTAVRDATVCDALAHGLVYVRSTPKARLKSGRYCWTIAKLGAHGSKQFNLVANVALRKGGPITNHATATAPGIQTARAAVTIHVRRAPHAPCATASSAHPPPARIAC
jgi:uncharacterized repeat protein (TIGR01451 family)